MYQNLDNTDDEGYENPIFNSEVDTSFTLVDDHQRSSFCFKNSQFYPLAFLDRFGVSKRRLVSVMIFSGFTLTFGMRTNLPIATGARESYTEDEIEAKNLTLTYRNILKKFFMQKSNLRYMGFEEIVQN